MTRVVALSDTHAPRFWKSIPAPVAAAVEGADLILHAGDVCVPSVLDELVSFAPVRVVLGNNDGPAVAAWGAPETLSFEVDGLRIAMIHDARPAPGRLVRMRRAFPEVDLVVFGHSHIPLEQSGLGLRIVNPGSPTDKRRQPVGTLAVLTVEDGELAAVEFVAVGGEVR